MDYLGKIAKQPLKIEKEINSSRKFYEPITFYFDDNESFNSFYFKIHKTMSDVSDRNNGRCIVEDSEKTKYIIDIEQINSFYEDLSIDVYVCGMKKLK